MSVQSEFRRYLVNIDTIQTRQLFTDCLVIGAGIAGIATAYYLCTRYKKASVLLVDSRPAMSFTSAQSGDNYRNWWPHPVMTAFTEMAGRKTRICGTRGELYGDGSIIEHYDFLTEKQFEFDRGEKLAGRSGRVWSPDFHVRAIRRSSVVYVLSTGSKSAARPIVNLVHTAFFDLNHLAAGPEALKFVSLFDDTLDVWSDEDFQLAEQLSTVTRWSQPNEFADVLANAA